MQNADSNMCETFHYDRSRNDRSLGKGKSDNNKNNKKNVCSVWRPVFSGLKCAQISLTVTPRRRCIHDVNRLDY